MSCITSEIAVQECHSETVTIASGLKKGSSVDIVVVDGN
jgi:hypothetical protein